MSGLASRLYRGDAGLQIVGRRKTWFAVAGVLVLIAIVSFVVKGFNLGIDFVGGDEFQIQAKSNNTLTVDKARTAVSEALTAVPKTGASAEVVTSQTVGTGN